MKSASVSAWAAVDHQVGLDDRAACKQGADGFAKALRSEAPVLRARCRWDGAAFDCPAAAR